MVEKLRENYQQQGTDQVMQKFNWILQTDPQRKDIEV